MGVACCKERRKDGDSVARRSLQSDNEYAKPKRELKSIAYQSKGVDANKFDKAFEANDLHAFVELLSSEQVVEPFEERLHPWAEDPKSIGALAGTTLAIMASGDEDMRARIRSAGAIPALVKFLESNHCDRVQIGLVALSFLTDNNFQNAVAAYDVGAMKILLSLLDSPSPKMRGCAATTLRNMAVQAREIKETFVNLDGIVGFIGVLKQCTNQEEQIEAILNLQDIVEDVDGVIDPLCAQEFKKAGGVAQLKELSKSKDRIKDLSTKDADVVEASAEFLMALGPHGDD